MRVAASPCNLALAQVNNVPSLASISTVSAPPVVFGLQDPDQTTWPQKLRLKNGELVDVQLIELNKGEKNLLLQDGECLSHVQIAGTKRGAAKENACLVCLQRVTISAKPGDGTQNARKQGTWPSRH